MRWALLLLLTSCASPAPDELHIWGSRGTTDGSSAYHNPETPARLLGETETEVYTLGVGFTWLLSAPPSRGDTEDILRELRALRHPAPAQSVTEAPGEIPVVVNGASREAWIGLLGGLTLLATAVAGYIGRKRIPVIRNIGKKGEG